MNCISDYQSATVEKPTPIQSILISHIAIYHNGNYTNILQISYSNIGIETPYTDWRRHNFLRDIYLTLGNELFFTRELNISVYTISYQTVHNPIG
jgi:hypothetical protein